MGEVLSSKLKVEIIIFHSLQLDISVELELGEAAKSRVKEVEKKWQSQGK